MRAHTWDAAQDFALCYKLVRLHEHLDAAEVFGHSQAHSSPVNPPAVCIWLLHHFSGTGKAGEEQELGEAPTAAVCRAVKGRRQNQAHAGGGGKQGQSISASTEGQVKKALSWGRHMQVDRGYCRIQNLHKKYTNGVRGDRVENIRAHTCLSAHTAALGHLQHWQIPLFPFDRDQGAHNSWAQALSLPHGTRDPCCQALWKVWMTPAPGQQVPVPELWTHCLCHASPDPWGFLG